MGASSGKTAAGGKIDMDRQDRQDLVAYGSAFLAYPDRTPG